MNVNLYPMAALLATRETINEELKIEVDSKWPFETWYKNKKISGILPEYKIENNKIKWLNLGIGINYGDKIPRCKLLIKIKNKILKYLDNKYVLLSHYSSTLNIIKKSYRFNIEGKTIFGKVNSIDILGTLTIETESGMQYGYIGNSTQEEEI